MPQAAPLRPGDPDRLGAYRLIGRLGEGGQGTVFLGAAAPADDAGPTGAAGPDSAAGNAAGQGIHVAIKLLHARLSGDAKARSRFAAEVAVAQRVSPFCTARILDADVEGDTPYIVSEYIDGQSLQDVVTAAGPRRDTALHRLAIGTVTALAAIHQTGVVHRDLKPSNVLLAADGPRVIDFGIARALDATGTLSSTTVGTPAYMSPEQISGAAVGPAADVFAWGCTIAFAAGGRPPFGQDSIPAVMNRILNLPPDLSMLDAPLHDLVAECLVKDPAARPTAQAVLLRLLGHAAAMPQGAPSAAVLTEGAQAASPRSAPPAPVAHAAAAPSPQPPPSQPPPSAPLSPPPGPAPAATAAPGPGGRAGLWGAAPPPPYPVQQAGPPPAQPRGPYSTDPSGGRQASTQPDAPPYRPLAGPYTQAPPHRRHNRPMILAGAGTAGFVAVVLVGTFFLIRLGSGGGGPTTPTPGGGGRLGGILRMATSFTPEAIDPSNASFGPEVFIAKQLFTGLTEVTPNGSVVRRLAQSLQPDATCRNWTITIRQGTTFSNGEAVDAQAFARGWNRAAKSANGYGLFVMDEIKGYREVNTGPAESLSGVQSFTDGLRVALTQPDCEFDRRLATVPFFPVPAAAGDLKNTSYNNRPIGNGPFRVETYTPSSKLTLARNETWFAGKAKLESVLIDLTAPAAGAVGAFDAGQYDWAEVNNADLNSATSRHRTDGELQSQLTDGIDFLIPVTARGPLRSKQAREAISYAIDRDALGDTLFGGTRPPATGLVPPALPGFRRSGICPSCERPDPAKAKELAAAAGLGPGTKVTFVTRNNSATSLGNDQIEQQVESVLGWQITQRKLEVAKFDDFKKALTGNTATGMGRIAWIGDYASAHNFLHSVIGGRQSSQFSDWRDTQFDGLLRQASETRDENTRNQLIQQAEKIALDDMALIPLWVTTQTRLINTKKFTGLDTDYDGDPTLATAALK